MAQIETPVVSTGRSRRLLPYAKMVICECMDIAGWGYERLLRHPRRRRGFLAMTSTLLMLCDVGRAGLPTYEFLCITQFSNPVGQDPCDPAMKRCTITRIVPYNFQY